MSDTATTDAARQELAAAAEREKQPTVFDLIERMTPALERALPQHLGAERFARIITTEIRRTPKLMECSPQSLLGAMMQSAQLGLEPGPLGHVYLVPFRGEVQLIVGYKGFADLAYRTGQVKDLSAAIVYDGDRFEYQYGTSPKLVHVPAGPPEGRMPTHFYALARLTTGGAPFVVLFPDDIEAARQRSAAKDSGPWVTDWPAMARKTPIRRLATGGALPMSPQLVRALNVDETTPAPVDVDETDALAELEAFAGEAGDRE